MPDNQNKTEVDLEALLKDIQKMVELAEENLEGEEAEIALRAISW